MPQTRGIDFKNPTRSTFPLLSWQLSDVSFIPQNCHLLNPDVNTLVEGCNRKGGNENVCRCIILSIPGTMFCEMLSLLLFMVIAIRRVSASSVLSCLIFPFLADHILKAGWFWKAIQIPHDQNSGVSQYMFQCVEIGFAVKTLTDTVTVTVFETM